ncbi:papain-like cysteine protease family protein [Polyangium sp. y55x31]|uniref:papain-like cysteine protease family protein n=1 Tax=Polyangium sp. y55x31 TaxID=3042688 RepID=UPI0024831138|nr:papain-like cysteine protease family protein [Polyangium sp. y55x31]MDI1482688.1 papain-like cysteine protease family protein [Polyangium sp. y55x31]
MSILYGIPEVAAQKGPTCWYYAAKMMLRFHGLIGAAERLEHEWRALHLVRQVISQLAAERKRYDNPAVVLRLTQMMQREPDGHRRALLREARNKLQSSPSTHRFDILDAFFRDVVRPLPLGNHAYGPSFVAEMLDAHGPLYASIHRLGDTLENDYVQDPLTNDRYVYKIETKCRVGGLHAIVVTGVDEAMNNVYYRDPNAPHRDTMVAWTTLEKVLNSPGGSLGDSLFGAIECQGCTHRASRRVA